MRPFRIGLRFLFGCCVAVALLWLPMGSVWAKKVVRQIPVAVISLQDDVRFDRRVMERHYPGQPAGRLIGAARLGASDVGMALSFGGFSLAIEDVHLSSQQVLNQALDKLVSAGVRYWLLDLPPQVIAQVSARYAGQALMWNVSSDLDALRAASCSPTLFHTYPSARMFADGLAQYVAARNWRSYLGLTGPLAQDQLLSQAWQRASKRYGLSPVDEKLFKLSGDPRERALGNIKLLTNDRNHDIVVVWDSHGEFARSLPYATQRPRPVVGSNGLVALAWHAQWPRNGGPQLSRRFKQNNNRDIVGQDWAAWVAIRSVAAVLLAEPTGDLIVQANALRSTVSVDGYKGPALSYRSWDGQLRQPVLLAHGDGVIATAPADGVLHPTEVLDTLGVDQRETTCKF
jgi:ABC transporter substrate binding protein (PQQ-dependent alcohol dehydrogenase system)